MMRYCTARKVDRSRRCSIRELNVAAADGLSLVLWRDGHRMTGGPELSNSIKWTMVFGQLLCAILPLRGASWYWLAFAGCESC